MVPRRQNGENAGERGSFRRRLLLIGLAALALRVAYAFVIAGDPLAGDAARYSAVGQAISAGRGFADPFVFDETVPEAQHPPLASLVLAPAAWITGTDAMYEGMTAFVFTQRLTMALVGAAGVVALGCVGRRVVGGRDRRADPTAERAGLVVAGLAAVNPALWINDALLMSEGVAALSVALVLGVAYRAWDEPTWRNWALLGGAVGVAALVRAEAILLAPVMVVPMLWWRHRPRWRELATMTAASAAAAAVVVATWVVPNLVRFDEPTFFSTNDGMTWLGANCPDTYAGAQRGFWSIECLRFVDGDGNGTDDWTDLLERRFGDVPPDASRSSVAYRREAFGFVGDHLGDVPAVVASRVGLAWGVFRPAAMVDFNVGEGRRPALSWLAWAAHLALTVPAALGVLRLRREGRPVWPLVSQAVCVTVTVAAVYGLARFRIGWDVAATVAAGAWLSARFPNRAAT